MPALRRCIVSVRREPRCNGPAPDESQPAAENPIRKANATTSTPAPALRHYLNTTNSPAGSRTRPGRSAARCHRPRRGGRRQQLRSVQHRPASGVIRFVAGALVETSGMYSWRRIRRMRPSPSTIPIRTVLALEPRWPPSRASSRQGSGRRARTPDATPVTSTTTAPHRDRPPPVTSAAGSTPTGALHPTTRSERLADHHAVSEGRCRQGESDSEPPHERGECRLAHGHP